MSFDKIRTYEVKREDLDVDHEKDLLKSFKNANINVKV